MGVSAEYLGMRLEIDDLDRENRAYFGYCAMGEFRLQRCAGCGLLRYPPGPGCPWCARPECEWVAVEGRGTVHSYGEVWHAIQPAFRGRLPYLLLLVDLDEQKGKPTEHEALRVAGNLVTAEGAPAPPEMVARVGIGTRARMVFVEAGEGIALPQWTVEESERETFGRSVWRGRQTGHGGRGVWRYPE